MQNVLQLNDGHTMPQLGFGVWQIPEDQTAAAVAKALEVGFRLIDTAAGYANEAGAGAGLRSAGLPRDETFVTTKLASSDHGYDEAMRAFDTSLGLLGPFDTSLGLLGLDYVDLYLIHWPRPSYDRYVETWRALAQTREEGRARSIGVSNFTEAHLQRLFDETGVVPTVNQIEVHPRFQQQGMRRFDASHGIVTQSRSPLGRGRLNDDPTLSELADRYGRSWAQIVLRWHIQSGLAVVTKSVTSKRMRENFAALSFELAAEDMARIAAMDDVNGRVSPHPDRQG
jgi:2,5-diketo-D-gluconate reductase A